MRSRRSSAKAIASEAWNSVLLEKSKKLNCALTIDILILLSRFALSSLKDEYGQMQQQQEHKNPTVLTLWQGVRFDAISTSSHEYWLTKTHIFMTWILNLMQNHFITSKKSFSLQIFVLFKQVYVSWNIFARLIHEGVVFR